MSYNVGALEGLIPLLGSIFLCLFLMDVFPIPEKKKRLLLKNKKLAWMVIIITFLFGVFTLLSGFSFFMSNSRTVTSSIIRNTIMEPWFIVDGKTKECKPMNEIIKNKYNPDELILPKECKKISVNRPDEHVQIVCPTENRGETVFVFVKTKTFCEKILSEVKGIKGEKL